VWLKWEIQIIRCQTAEGQWSEMFGEGSTRISWASFTRGFVLRKQDG